MSTERDFYVGYLPTPARDARFLFGFLPALALALMGVALVLAGFQRDPGDGRWETGQEITLEGELIAAPFPMLRIGSSAGDIERVLLERWASMAQGLGWRDSCATTARAWRCARAAS